MIQQIILQISFYQRTNVDIIVFCITFNAIVWTATPTHRQQKTFNVCKIIKIQTHYQTFYIISYIIFYTINYDVKMM